MSRYVASGLFIASILSAVHGQDTTAAKPSPPTAQDWAKLNATVGGKLSPGVPWAEPCFTSYKGVPQTPNAAQCSFVEQNFFNNHLNRSSAFGGYSATNFETCMATGDECELDWTSPTNRKAFAPPTDCKQGSISDFFIDVRDKSTAASDVAAALSFVKAKGIPLVIKNTGHDFKGRSSAPGSLALWMHNLKYISHVPSFVPDGCKLAPNDAVTFGAGQQFQEIYQFAHDNNILVVGGSDQSVGAAGGWGQGGGHSSLSPTLGMGADRTLQYKVVTTDGILRTVNACQNSDLFFALRGGGGGTFGIVLEATMMAAPASSFRIANINWPASDANLKQILPIFLANATTFATQGWGGYLTPSAGNLVMTTPKLNTQQAQQSMQALITLTTKLGGVSNISEVPDYLSWFQGWVQGVDGAQDAIGLPNALGSRLIPQKNHATAASRAQLQDAILNLVDNSFFSQFHFTTPFGFNATDAADTSVNPVWRTSLYQIISVNTWDFNSTLSDRQAAYAATTKALSTIRSITPDSGAYHNEADVHEPNHEVSFWGANFPRLLSIKNKYDPNHVLDCWHCVGWQGVTNPRFKCYI